MRQHYFDPPALDNWLYLLARLWAAEFNIRDRPGRDHIQHWNAFDELEDSNEFNITDPLGRDNIQHWSVAAEHVRENPQPGASSTTPQQQEASRSTWAVL